MNKQEKTEYSTHQTKNGLASDTDIHAQTSATTAKKEEIKGYALVIGGITLFLYNLDLFPFLTYVVAAGALVMIFFGAKKAHLIERGQELIDRMKNKN